MGIKTIIKGGFKTHWLYILILILLILANLGNFISLIDLPTIDHTTTYFARAKTLKLSIEKFGDYWPLWNPYLMAGTPFMGYVNTLGIDSITGWLTFIFPSTVTAININYVLDLLLAGITMYILIYYITKKQIAALIAGLVYSFCGSTIVLFSTGSLTQLNGMTVTPLIVLFMIKIFKKDWLINSLITGILFALQIRFTPDLKISLFTVLMFGIFLLIQLLTNPTHANAKKVFAAGLVVGLVVFCLSAQRILPGKEFIDMTSRSHLSFEESASRKTAVGNLFDAVIEPIYKELPKIRYGEIASFGKHHGDYKIGIISFLIICLALAWGYKNKLVIFFGATVVFVFSITTGSFVFYLLLAQNFPLTKRLFSIIFPH